MSPAYLRAGSLYLPIVAAMLAGVRRRPEPRQFAACLLSLLWTLPALLLLQIANLHARWWSFATDGATLRAMPLELYLGWLVLWGVLPQLAMPRLPLAVCAAVMAALDLAVMPLCRPVVQLRPRWLVGEAAAVVLVLCPALAIARWTLTDTRLKLRATLQVATSALLFLFFLPELIFATRPHTAGWRPMLELTGWRAQLAVMSVLLVALPGVSAVFEFAERGQGTPIPYDPPRRLVASGVYRYIANPMQLSCTLTMLLWAALLHSGWMLLGACITIVYSAGIAEWDEHEDLNQRFAAPWRQYRAEVRNWLPRLHPYISGPPAAIYIARTCGPCSELRAWLEARQPFGLELRDAEELPQGSIRRIRYQPRDGSAPVEGVRAVARALEHLHVGWAFAGAALRLPLLWRAVQLVMDASGFGPRTLSTPAPQHPPRSSCVR
ncbi:Phospholipid methyltransferase [Granulicella rosea]|uniref:Phospholipid methyltransferase n=1 Tax=Granulicella rosea TaxID=474952 RepID=A0A239E5F9_9BACT|nr:isoprenylcysteine carboxylmethyltransferase family protein [Granulicella rosea]SNS39671.1 Phospholipid methyltransferase [Granulicella rosea]